MGDRMPLSFEVLDRGFRFYFADASRATHARGLFIAYLSGQVSPDCDLFNIELVFGEILGNVARHAPGPVDIEVIWEDTGARLEVWDQGPGYELDVAYPGPLEEAHRGLFLVSEFSDEFRVERRAGRTVTSVMLPIQRAVTTGSVKIIDEVCVNDSTTLTTLSDRIPLAAALAPATESIEEVPPEVVAVRDARQRAAEARALAERALQQAQAAEAQLVAQMEEALAVAAAAKREKLAENARAAAALEREAVETLSALQFQISRLASMKLQAEAAVAASRASLAEHEDELCAAEAKARQLQADIAVAARNVQECMRAREQAEAALNASKSEPPPTVSIAAQRAAERRAADAARAKGS